MVFLVIATIAVLTVLSYFVFHDYFLVLLLVMSGLFPSLFNYRILDIKWLNIFNLVFLILSLKMLSYFSFKKFKIIKYKDFLIWVIGFLLALFLSVMRSKYILNDIVSQWKDYFIRPLQWVVISIFVLHFFSFKEIKKLFRNLGYLSASVGLFVIVYTLVKTQGGISLNYRFMRELPVNEHPVIYGGYFTDVTMLFIPFAFSSIYRKYSRMALIFVSVFSIVVIFSLARSALISLFIGFLYFSFMKYRKINFFILFLAAFLLWIFPLDVLVERLQTGLSGSFFDADRLLSGRLDFLWLPAILSFKKNLLFGGGRFAFAPITLFHSTDLIGGGTVMNYHSQYLQILTDMGITGFAFYAGIIVTMFREAIFVYKSSQDPFSVHFAEGYILFLSSYCIQSLTASLFYTPLNLGIFWITASMLLWIAFKERARIKVGN